MRVFPGNILHKTVACCQRDYWKQDTRHIAKILHRQALNEKFAIWLNDATGHNDNIAL